MWCVFPSELVNKTFLRLKPTVLLLLNDFSHIEARTKDFFLNPAVLVHEHNNTHPHRHTCRRDVAIHLKVFSLIYSCMERLLSHFLGLCCKSHDNHSGRIRGDTLKGHNKRFHPNTPGMLLTSQSHDIWQCESLQGLLRQMVTSINPVWVHAGSDHQRLQTCVSSEGLILSAVTVIL